MKTRTTALWAALTLGTLLTTTSPARAQERPNRPGGRGGGMQERFQQMAEKLNLTAEQKEKLKAVFQSEFQEQGEKLRSLREDTSLSPEEKRAKMRELFQGMEEKIKPILTAEQQEKWKTLRAEAGPGAGAGNPQERMKQLVEKLNLTTEQKEKFEAVIKDEGAKMKELRENQSLSREEKMAKFRDMRQDIEAKLKPILTPEQLEKWQQMRPQPGQRPGRPAQN